MNILTSRANPLITETASLQQRKYRKETGCFFFEGRKLFEEAISVPEAAAALVHIFVTESYFAAHREALSGREIILVSEAVFEKISTEKSPEGILCTSKALDFLHKRTTIYGELPADDRHAAFLAADISDPGNLGTMLRTACALGMEEVILNAGCADLYNPKTIRASMGAIFRQRITVCEDFLTAIAALRGAGRTVLAAALDRGARRLGSFDAHGCCFLVGNEGHGLPQNYIDACDGSVFIPIRENTESLNAAAAANILLWEARS